MRAPRVLAAAVLASLLLAAAPARADIWGYIDARGIAHFASEKLDDRYELFLRGGNQAAAASAGNDAPADVSAGGPIELPAPDAPPRLLAFFEVSTNYKAVRHLLRDASRQYDLEYELLKALIATESGFDPRAISPKGAIGLMQLIPETAARYGVQADRHQTIERKLSDPATNIRAGSRFLRYLINLFPGRLDLAIAAYNAGEGAVQRAGNRIPNYPETQNYVRTVMQLYQALKPPAALVERRGGQGARPRVQVVMPAAPAAGGAIGRGNMVPPLGNVGPPLGGGRIGATTLPADPRTFEFKIERD